MSITANRIGRRTALWHAIGREMRRRHRLGLPFPPLDHVQIAMQISAAARLEILWQCEPSQLAKQILDRPFSIPKGDELFELDHSITMHELGGGVWEEELREIALHFQNKPMQKRFTGEGVKV